MENAYCHAVIFHLYSNQYPTLSWDIVRIQLEYKWDIVNNLDGFFMRIPVEKLGYSYGMQHVNTEWDTLNTQKN